MGPKPNSIAKQEKEIGYESLPHETWDLAGNAQIWKPNKRFLEPILGTGLGFDSLNDY